MPKTCPTGMKVPTWRLIKKVAAVAAAGATKEEISHAVGKSPKALALLKSFYPAVWKAEFQEAVLALTLQEAPPPPPKEPPVPAPRKGRPGPPDGPTAKTRELIRRAASLSAAGMELRQVAAEMGVSERAVRNWKESHPLLWDEELSNAMATARMLVTKLAGTDQVLLDPDAFLRMAMRVDRWSAAGGTPLFPASDDHTLSSFFEAYYLPRRLSDASPFTVEQFRTCLKKWRLFTGDPPLEKITADTLVFFRDCLKRTRGIDGIHWCSSSTVHKVLNHVQIVLGKAGPPGFRNKDAAGLLERVPWIKPPRPRQRIPRFISPAAFKLLYDATAGMDVPRVDGISPPSWWKTFLVVAFNCPALRFRSLFELEMSSIDWKNRRLEVPQERLKGNRPLSIHLNDAALEHLAAIRTDRARVFPGFKWRSAFYKYWRRLLKAAGINGRDRFALQAVRSTVGTMLWEENPSAAQFALGHTAMSVTQRHYIAGRGLVARAVDALAQPWGASAAIAAPTISAEIIDRRAGLVKALDAAGVTVEEAARLLNERPAGAA
ncbi:MAG: tyrosine-type recombinase/integrase [Thermoguttaceae bacterium]